MVELTHKFKDDIDHLVKEIPEDEFKKGIIAFEQLINISDPTSNFNQELGVYLNEHDIHDEKYNIANLCRLEGILRKICRLQGVNTEGFMMQNLYTHIGFYSWLNDDEIKAARAKDEANSANAANLPGEGFSLRYADSQAYAGCPHYFMHYIIAYQFRNGGKAHDFPIDKDPIIRLSMIKSVMIVFLDQCIKNADLIGKKYLDEVLSTEVNFSEFAKKRINEIPDREREVLASFIQLDWSNNKDDKDIIKYDYSRCVKLYGEPGLGKTTQMREMYFRLLNDVKDGKKDILPIWIDLADFSFVDESDASLEAKISDTYPEIGKHYKELLENNKIAFFLDGYNEILSDDDYLKVKRKISLDIQDIHEDHPERFIAMTDRSVDSNPPCLSSDVILYTCKGLTLKQMLEYAKAKAGEEISQKIDEYINGVDGEWFASLQVSPTKMNSLIDLIKNGNEPEDEEEFYEAYLEYVIDRERNEKKETRMSSLLDALGELTGIMNHESDEKRRSEIRNLWKDSKIVGQEFDNYLRLASELGILVPGVGDNTYKFGCPQYYEAIKMKWG